MVTGCKLQVVKDWEILAQMTLKSIATKAILDVFLEMDLWCFLHPAKAKHAQLTSEKSNHLLFHHLCQLLAQPLANLICQET